MPGPVLLTSVDHHDLRVSPARGERWGDAVNQVTVFPTEFEELAREVPIVFRRDGADGWVARALLGFRAGENLFLDAAAGRWTTRAIPALLERGPFSIGVPRGGGPGEPMIHIDPDHPAVDRTVGARLFLEHGGHAPLLDRMAGVLRTIFEGAERAGTMYAAWDAAGLFDPVSLEIESAGDRRFTVPDVWVLHPARFAALDDAALGALHRADQLRPAVWAMSSLGNVPRLAALAEARGG
jgi:hypothetical protein